jgi:hypothetical protein
MDVRPVFDDIPEVLDIDNFVIGASFGPMTITPEIAEPATGRTYAASIYLAGVAVADFVITHDDVTGELDLSMTDTESATIPAAGSYDLAIVYTAAGGIKRPAWIGKLTAIAVPGITPVVP